MNQKKLSLWLKGVTIALAVMLLGVFFVLCPMAEHGLAWLSPGAAGAYHAYFIFARVVMLPCFAALWFFWRICCNIGADRSFCAENVHYLKWITVLALADTFLCFCSVIVFACVARFGAGFYIGSLLLVVIGITVALASLVLSHLTEKAAALKNENDLTI